MWILLWKSSWLSSPGGEVNLNGTLLHCFTSSPDQDSPRVYKNSVYELSIDCAWNVMAHAQKPDFVVRRNGRVHLNLLWRQFSRVLAAEVCTSAVVMLDTPCSEVVWRVRVTNSLRQFPIHFPSRALQCAITFQMECTKYYITLYKKECADKSCIKRVVCASVANNV